MDIYLVRHGQAEGNEEAIFKHPDAPLTKQGIEESHQLAQKIKQRAPDLIVTGPLLRTKQTAEIIQSVNSVPLSIHDGFAGIRHATSMAGKSKEGPEARAYLEVIKRMYSDDPAARFEDAENYTELHTRLCNALHFLEQRTESTIVVVTHESILKSLLILILHNMEYNPVMNIDLKHHIGSMTNTGITKFTYKESWKLISWNEN